MKIQFSSQQVVPQSFSQKTGLSFQQLPTDKVFLRFGSNDNVSKQLTGKNWRLFEAIDTADFMQMVALIRSGVDVNIKNEEGITPSMRACWAGSSKKRDKITTFLASLPEVDINATDKWGRTVLHAAASQRNLKVVSALLQRKDLDVNIVSQEGRAPLLESIRDRTGRITKLLLKHPKIDVNQKDNENDETPLLYAVSMENAAAVKHLLARRDTNLGAQNINGETALTLITQKIAKAGSKYDVEHHRILQMLAQKQGIPVNVADKLKLMSERSKSWVLSVLPRL